MAQGITIPINARNLFPSLEFLFFLLILFLVVQGHGGAVLKGSIIGELEAGGWMQTLCALALAMAGGSMLLCT